MSRRHPLEFAIAAALLLAAVLLGCAEADRPPSVKPAPREATGSAEPTPPARQAPLADIELGLEPIAQGLDGPLWLTHAGDGSGRLFVLEQAGRIRVIRDGELLKRPYLDLTDRISTGGERGLLGLAFAPDFESSGELYVNYTDPQGNTVVARYTADDPASDAPSLDGPRVLFTVDQPYANHNGGCIVFGSDGKLWVGMGDGGSGGDPQNRAQNPDSLLGKMLTVDVAAGDSAEPEVRYVGLRNPWRFSFDRTTGDLWIADVGQNAFEEVNFVPADKTGERLNFGWNEWEGDHPHPGGSERSREGFTFPVIEYGRDSGQSVTGGYVYRGSAHPELTGAYLYADFAAGWVAGARISGGSKSMESPESERLLDRAGSVSSFGEDEEGELYLCDLGGTVYRITVER